MCYYQEDFGFTPPDNANLQQADAKEGYDAKKVEAYRQDIDKGPPFTGGSNRDNSIFKKIDKNTKKIDAQFVPATLLSFLRPPDRKY